MGLTRQAPVFYPNPAEVAEVITFPLHRLLDAETKHHEYREFNGSRFRVPFYNVRGHKVWGATAVMLSELEQRILAAL